MAKRTVPKRGKGSKTAHKTSPKKTPPPSRKRPTAAERREAEKRERRNALARERRAAAREAERRETERRERAREQARQRRARTRAAELRQRRAAEREERELQRLIEEQEEAAREAERQEARERREAEREEERELQRLIRSQEAARREAEREAQKLKELEEWFEKQAALEQKKVERQRRRAEKAERERQLVEWQKAVEKERVERGMSRKQRAEEKRRDEQIRREAEASKTVEDYIEESLQGVYDCMRGLGYRTDKPIYNRLPDRSFDAEIRINDPDDTTGSDALLQLQKCILPIVGAWVLIGFRHYPSDWIERRIEMAEAGGKRLPGSLAQKEFGLYTNLTNYRRADQTNIGAHVDAVEKWLRDFATQNRAYCAQIFVRYYYSPDGKAPQ